MAASHSRAPRGDNFEADAGCDRYHADPEIAVAVPGAEPLAHTRVNADQKMVSAEGDTNKERKQSDEACYHVAVPC